MIAVVYSDASYCHKNDIAACGFIVLFGHRIVKHQVILVKGLKTPTGAELYSLVVGIQYAFLLNDVKSIQANTDCIALVNKVKSRKKYAELFDTIEIVEEFGIGFTLRHVKGHAYNKYNNKIDNSCITELRKYLQKDKRKWTNEEKRLRQKH
jgi:ribonuclease HI